MEDCLLALVSETLFGEAAVSYFHHLPLISAIAASGSPILSSLRRRYIRPLRRNAVLTRLRNVVNGQRFMF